MVPFLRKTSLQLLPFRHNFYLSRKGSKFEPWMYPWSPINKLYVYGPAAPQNPWGKGICGNFWRACPLLLANWSSCMYTAICSWSTLPAESAPEFNIDRIVMLSVNRLQFPAPVKVPIQDILDYICRVMSLTPKRLVSFIYWHTVQTTMYVI